MNKQLLEVLKDNEDIVISMNCSFKELFSIVMHLVTKLADSTDGEISYNEILEDLALVEDQATNETYQVN